MQVKVVLFGMLRERLAKESRGRLVVDLPEAATIADMLVALGIQVPVVCSLNGVIERDFSRTLADGDEAQIFQPAGGGLRLNNQASMSTPRLFIARFIPEEYLNQARAICQVDLWPDDLPPPRDILLERVKGVDGILSLLTDRIDVAVMDAAGPGLKVISNCAVGFDNIDVSEATRRGIPVGNTPGVLTDTTADFAFALLLAAARRVVEGHNYVRAGRWHTWGLTQLLGQDIAGATLGIIGFGRIGKAVAKRAQGFDMRILYYDPACEDDPYAAQIGANCVDLDTILRQSDYLSLHVPLYKDTYHFIGESELAKMKPTAVLVNTARGGVVDPDALYRALRDGVIGYAALDVTEPEPIPLDHPLLSLENVIIAPHIASASVQTRGKMIEIALANLLAGVKGEQLRYCVNPQVYMTDLE